MPICRFLQSLDDQLEDANSPIWNVDFDLKGLPDIPADAIEESKTELAETSLPDPTTSAEPTDEYTGAEATTMVKLDPLTVKTDDTEAPVCELYFFYIINRMTQLHFSPYGLNVRQDTIKKWYFCPNMFVLMCCLDNVRRILRRISHATIQRNDG